MYEKPLTMITFSVELNLEQDHFHKKFNIFLIASLEGSNWANQTHWFVLVTNLMRNKKAKKKFNEKRTKNFSNFLMSVILLIASMMYFQI